MTKIRFSTADPLLKWQCWDTFRCRGVKWIRDEVQRINSSDQRIWKSVSAMLSRAETRKQTPTKLTCHLSRRCILTISLLYFVIRAWPLTPTCHYVSLWSYRPSVSVALRPLRSGLALALLPLLAQGVPSHNTPFQLPKPVSSLVDFRVLIWTSLINYLGWRFMTLTTDVSSNPLESPPTPPNTSPSPVPERLISPNPTFCNLTVQRCC